jgi:predicted nuclease with RNAse H fold
MKVRRHRKKRTARAMVIDCGWSRNNWSRTSVAWSDSNNNRVKVDLLDPDEWVEDWVRQIVMPGGVIAIDLPLEGYEELSPDLSFRPVDRGFIKAGIPLLPAGQTGGYGQEIANRVREAAPDCQVVEVYPYAILRVLWSLTFVSEHPPIKLLDNDDWNQQLDPRVWRKKPPRYKRATNREEMARALRRALSVLDGSPYGRAFDDLSDEPLSLMSRSELLRMTDAFDGLLGLVALDRFVRCSPYAKNFSIPGKQGAIVGLADPWLWARWGGIARDLSL